MLTVGSIPKANAGGSDSPKANLDLVDKMKWDIDMLEASETTKTKLCKPLAGLSATEI